MTVRSAPVQRLSERPKISFVFPVHDPEYGGGLLARTQKHLDALIALANRYQLLSEIIVVEWNPRQDRAPFRESLRWCDDLGYVCLRFLEVPAELHRTLPNADRIPIFEYIAKNAGLRRARGQFLLATNPDLFYSPALVRWLARTSLSPDRFYRVDRRDLSEDIPRDRSLAGQLRFCSRHVAQVHARFGSYRASDTDGARRLSEEYDRWFHDTTGAMRRTEKQDVRLVLPADGLHRNAAGDFFLMERGWWHQLRGYPELYTHAHVDAILCWVASSAGLVQEILPTQCHLFHQAHHRSSHADFPQTDWKPWYKRYREALRQGASHAGPPMVDNPADWGLSNQVLREWQASPQLVPVETLPGELGEASRRFERSHDVAESVEPSSREKLKEVEMALARTRSDLQRAQAWLEEAVQKQAAMRAALREAQSAHEAERVAAENLLRKSQRAHKAERATLKAALREARAAQRLETALRHKLESSTAWRLTWLIRWAFTSVAGLRRAPPPAPRVHGAEDGVSEGREHGPVAKPKRERVESAIDRPVPAPTPTRDATPAFPQQLPGRFRETDALRVFHVPRDAPRVSIVIDGISASSLLSGAVTALVLAALLARHLGARLRVITLTDPPEPGNVVAVLATHRIPWTGDIDFVHVGLGRKEELPISEQELFLTTSWWSTRRAIPIVDPGRLVYLIQEDERMLHASDDDRLRCVETLSDPNIRFVINSRPLFDHLTQGPDALPNVLAHGVWFDPAALQAGSGAVVTTAQHGSKTSRASGVNQIIADPDGVHVNPDWEAVLAPVLARLYPDRRLG